MSATKKKTLLLIVACIVIPAVWFAADSYQPLKYERKPPPRTKDDILAADYRKLKSVYTGGWEEAALRVAVYGDPDEATEAILGRIENPAIATRESSELLEDWSDRSILGMQGGIYHRRIAALAPLGRTRTKRAEEYLLKAYKNPQDVVPNKKWVLLGNKMQDMGHNTQPDPGFIDAVTRRNAMIGLLLLNEPKYSLMLEEDFYASVPDTERIYKKERAQRTKEEKELVSRNGVLLDLLGIRDTIRRRGAEYPVYLLNRTAMNGPMTKYWNFQTDTAVPRR